MRTTWFVAAIVAGSFMVSVNASGQAAAEAVLTHGLASSAGSSIGNALGKALNGATGQLGQQVSNTVQRPVVTNVKPGAQKRAKVPVASSETSTALNMPMAGSGSLIASIDGAAPGTSACPAVAAGGTSNAGATTQKNNCVAKPPAEVDSHPSEITLPAPQ